MNGKHHLAKLATPVSSLYKAMSNITWNKMQIPKGMYTKMMLMKVFIRLNVANFEVRRLLIHKR